jgi:hypothetical protein
LQKSAKYRVGDNVPSLDTTKRVGVESRCDGSRRFVASAFRPSVIASRLSIIKMIFFIVFRPFDSTFAHQARNENGAGRPGGFDPDPPPVGRAGKVETGRTPGTFTGALNEKKVRKRS